MGQATFSVQKMLPNTTAIIPVSSRGAKKIPSLCSEQAVRSRLYRMRLPLCARNDIVKIYIAFILAWIIHGSSLPQMRGTGYAAVVLHRRNMGTFPKVPSFSY